MSNLFFAAESSTGTSFPVLTSLIVVPFIGALLVLAVPRGRVEVHRLIALAASVITGAMSFWVLLAFDKTDGGFQFRSDDPTI